MPAPRPLCGESQLAAHLMLHTGVPTAPGPPACRASDTRRPQVAHVPPPAYVAHRRGQCGQRDSDAVASWLKVSCATGRATSVGCGARYRRVFCASRGCGLAPRDGRENDDLVCGEQFREPEKTCQLVERLDETVTPNTSRQ